MFPPHITLEELTRSQTAARNSINNTPNDGQLENLERLAWFLETLRTKIRRLHSGAVIIVSSGLRVELLNSLIGGSKTSAHMEGLAADITCNKLTPLELAKFIKNNMKNDGYDQVIHEFERWVHIGLADNKPRYEQLTALKQDGRTIYKQGLV